MHGMHARSRTKAIGMSVAAIGHRSGCLGYPSKKLVLDCMLKGNPKGTPTTARSWVSSQFLDCYNMIYDAYKTNIIFPLGKDAPGLCEVQKWSTFFGLSEPT